jgi:hypothetical protein
MLDGHQDCSNILKNGQKQSGFAKSGQKVNIIVLNITREEFQRNPG